MEGKERKDGRICTWKRERMGEYGRGREKGWQIMDREEGRGKIGKKNERMAECGRGLKERMIECGRSWRNG
jgi:hypothetical protein